MQILPEDRSRAPKTLFVRDIAPGAAVAGTFLLTEARSGQAKNGPFWSIRLEDVSGGVEAKIWSPLSLAFDDLRPGTYVAVQGAAQLYRDKLQLNLERMDILDPSDPGLDPADFLASSARPPEEMLAELEDLLKAELRHKPWSRLAAKVLADATVRAKLLEAPGAKSMHHAYRGGLLEHTLAVCRLVVSICELYPALDRQTLLAAAAFHDLGKAWELSASATREYTDAGRLVGHITLGLEVLAPFLAKSGLSQGLIDHFKHLLLSHHGTVEYGSPRLPMTGEAFVLHFADNMDAKLNTIGSLFEETAEAEETWSPYQRGLDRQIFNPARTPKPAGAGPDEATSRQCLLPLKA